MKKILEKGGIWVELCHPAKTLKFQRVETCFLSGGGTFLIEKIFFVVVIIYELKNYHPANALEGATSVIATG